MKIVVSVALKMANSYFHFLHFNVLSMGINNNRKVICVGDNNIIFLLLAKFPFFFLLSFELYYNLSVENGQSYTLWGIRIAITLSFSTQSSVCEWRLSEHFWERIFFSFMDDYSANFCVPLWLNTDWIAQHPSQ